MGYDVNKARAVHFNRMQQALEEGLKAIEAARSPHEADAARQRAQRRLEDLNRKWAETFGDEDGPQED
ncbi:hypothetical protein FJ250_07315 [bacterium]|nr:hypothetical protein [bacterium]